MMKVTMMMLALATTVVSQGAFAVNNTALLCGTPGQPVCKASADLQLAGTVPPRCALTIAAEPSAKKLNLVSGESSTLVATVNEQTNNLAGYRVTVRSANGGQLVNASSPSAKVGYKMSYDGAAPIVPTTTAQQVKVSGALASAANDNSEVRVTIPASPSALAGTYSDTLTFEIAAM